MIKLCLISSLERKTSSKVEEHYTLLTLLSHLPPYSPIMRNDTSYILIS